MNIYAIDDSYVEVFVNRIRRVVMLLNRFLEILNHYDIFQVHQQPSSCVKINLILLCIKTMLSR